MSAEYPTHAGWCLHLWHCGALKDSHEVCIKADRCVAGGVADTDAAVALIQRAADASSVEEIEAATEELKQLIESAS